MKKKYILTTTLFVMILAGLFYAGYHFTYRSLSKELIRQQLQTARYQSELVSNLLSDQLEKGTPKDTVIQNLQHALEHSSSRSVFICMFDQHGRELSHPERKKVGIIADKNRTIKSLSNTALEENFKHILRKKIEFGGLQDKDNLTEIIHLCPVKNVDWVVASHSSLTSMQSILSEIKLELMLFFCLAWIFTTVLVLLLINYIYHKYFCQITEDHEQLKEDLILQLRTEKESLMITPEKSTAKRFLTGKGIKLVPVEADEIAYFYLENTITYVVHLNGSQSTLNLPLEHIYKDLDKDQFFRVSRQYIISLKAIQNIEKYGITQLKVITAPASQYPIIVSKAKVSEFRMWIGK